MTLIRNALKMK